MDCTSKLVQKLFSEKFSCARTKAEAIALNVLAPSAEEELKTDLQEAKFVSVFCDASNHKDLKVLPIMVRYFTAAAGVQTKLLEINTLPGETSAMVSQYIMDALEANQVTSKLVAFSADNANCNFGGAARNGKNNVFSRLQDSVDHKILGIGCAAHIVHNTVQTAADCLPLDIEAVIVKIYSYFYIYTVRVESFKEFCDFASVEYQRLLGYSKTRWLALMPAVERVLKLYPALKAYFLSIDKCPSLIKSFFEDPCGELWLYFLHSQAAMFESTVLQIEGDTKTAVEVYSALSQLQTKVQQRYEQSYLPSSVRSRATELEEQGQVRREQVVNTVVKFYATCASYLDRWCQQFDEVRSLLWVSLVSSPCWDDVQKTVELITSEFNHVTVDENAMFDEINNVSHYVTAEKIKEWKTQKISVGERWVEILGHFEKNDVPCENLKTVLEYCMCLPGTNAPVERVFSLMNKIWTAEKTQLKVATLKAMLVLKVNVRMTCEQYFAHLCKKEHLLKKIHSSQKY
ncbi:hypothetical protein V5799_003777 [Amblyomma americanum]|uniref:HAT C-terminal dimerisation domain-containing protein n=1 Tax=Amblyomma americanum TaxID=6943 RepID=A0AAQ4D802_AMBAM